MKRLDPSSGLVETGEKTGSWRECAAVTVASAFTVDPVATASVLTSMSMAVATPNEHRRAMTCMYRRVDV